MVSIQKCTSILESHLRRFSDYHRSSIGKYLRLRRSPSFDKLLLGSSVYMVLSVGVLLHRYANIPHLQRCRKIYALNRYVSCFICTDSCLCIDTYSTPFLQQRLYHCIYRVEELYYHILPMYCRTMVCKGTDESHIRIYI